MTSSNWRLTLLIGGTLFALMFVWLLISLFSMNFHNEPPQAPSVVAVTSESHSESHGQQVLSKHITRIQTSHAIAAPSTEETTTPQPHAEETAIQPLNETKSEPIEILTSQPISPPESATASIAISAPSSQPTRIGVYRATVKEAVYDITSLSIPVLNYHSVTVQPGNPAAITPAKLEEQMQYLADQGYTTLTLQQFLNIWEGQEQSPAKPILLTFDDGYKDNYTAAMPILAKHNFHATLFMSPGMVGDGYFLTWEEVKEMHKGGWDIQPHGMTHPHLPRLNKEKQTHEITEARRQIEEELGVTANIYCYPYGERNQTTLNILEANKFRYAFTIDQGRAKPDQHPYLIRRLFVNGESSMSSFKALLK